MSVWLPTAPCTPRACGTHHGPVAAATVAAVRVGAGLFFVLAGALLSTPVALLGAGARDRLTRVWARNVLRVFGLRIRVVGAPLPPRGAGVLVVSNHISWLDIPLLAALFPGRVLAKSEIRQWPVLGGMAARGGTLFVERERLRALPETVRTLATALTEGSRVVVFPEGCTWCGRDQGRFTRAVFQSALDAGAPVRPVRITYRTPSGTSSGAPAFVGDDSLPASLWRVARAGGLTAEITVLPLIPAGRHADRRSLALAAQRAVAGDTAAGDTAIGDTPAARTTAGDSQRAAASQRAVASDSANRPPLSVHHCVSSIPAALSSARTPS
ncbi:lysophospholipid acyltransferase family protein [Streptomyces sp. NPDC088261]|uniref:lysophospholipid acyltransferase family protein n=1 Tax=Streptomyces sp. NPDC088261 TaxID=3365851 RepID=UPI003814D952